MKKIILLHVLLFLVLTGIFVLASEGILNLLLPGYHQVEHWLLLITNGTILLFILTLISCIVYVLRYKRKLKT